MSNNLILIITIFGFWLFTYLSNIRQAKQQNQQPDKKGINADSFQFGKTIEKQYKPKITSPVSPKGD